MFTHVPDASAPTRLSALSDVPAYNYAADIQRRFYFALLTKILTGANMKKNPQEFYDDVLSDLR